MSDDARQRIARTFVELLSQKQMDDITIKELTRAAGVNRSTFYYHFGNTYDVLEYLMAIFLDAMDQFFVATGLGPEGTDFTYEIIQARSIELLEHFKGNAALVQALLASSKREEFLERMRQKHCNLNAASEQSFKNVADGTTVRLEKDEEPFYMNGVAASVISYIVMWAERDFKEPPERILQMMETHRLLVFDTRRQR